ncbi:hypothetical protein SAMN05880593_11373 [Rhizobium sp. RU36D]|nr:hypothetical protein SAMN05880593_11373 [Rhizobium sp. RU36D]
MSLGVLKGTAEPKATGETALFCRCRTYGTQQHHRYDGLSYYWSQTNVTVHHAATIITLNVQFNDGDRCIATTPKPEPPLCKT